MQVIQNKREFSGSLNNQKNPFVSVIIPTFNRSAYLKNAIESVTSQNYPKDEFEIIIVDNSSSDDTPEMVKNNFFSSEESLKVSYIIEKRRGLVYCRHTGAYHAKGEILIFGDDDAIYEKNWIMAIVDVYKNNPDVGAVGTKILIRWDTPPESWVLKYEDLMGKLDMGNHVLVRDNLFINGGSFSIRKNILFKVQGFHPGQHGDFLLGDSESGLCRKLFRDKVLIGWTPDTVMWHLQMAERNGTEQDIKRRFFNNGIAAAYDTLFNSHTFRDFSYKILMIVAVFFKKQIISSFSLIMSPARENFLRELTFENGFILGYLKYLYLYSFNGKIKSEISRKDWELTNNYSAPEPLLTK